MTSCLHGWVMFSPSKPEVTGGPYEIAHRVRLDAQRVDVDQPVQIAQPLPVGLPLVQCGAQRRADAGADEPDEKRVLGHDGPPVTAAH